MMQSMIDFSTAMLSALSEFLIAEPMIYLLGLVCFLFVVKAFKILCTKGGDF